MLFMLHKNRGNRKVKYSDNNNNGCSHPYHILLLNLRNNNLLLKLNYTWYIRTGEIETSRCKIIAVLIHIIYWFCNLKTNILF